MLEDHKIKNQFTRKLKAYDVLVDKISTLKKFDLDTTKEEMELLEMKCFLTNLTKMQREAFILHVIKGVTIDRIALDYNVSRGVVRHKISEVYGKLERV